MVETDKDFSTVTDAILDKFISTLSSEPEYNEIASRLQTMLSNKKYSEGAIRSALFNEELP